MADYDLISKTALLRHLDMAIDCKDCPRNTDRKTYYERCACSEVADICSTITYFATFADVQPVDRWISCKDRLPEENILVLCYARSTTGEGNNYFLGALAHGEFWFLKVNDIGHVSCPVLHWEVTHWQPLPEPPKDGDANGRT